MALKPIAAMVIAKNFTEQSLEGAGALKGEDGVSPIISENPNNTDKIYRLDIENGDGTKFTTPDLKGDDGSGVPGGGITGEVLGKKSDEDGDVEWLSVKAEESSGERTVLFEEQTLEGFSYSTGYSAYVYSLTDPGFILKEGEKYAVLWDGVEYDCNPAVVHVYGDDEAIVIGNSLATGGEQSEEPFAILYFSDSNSCSFLSLDTSASHDVGIYQKVEVIGLPPVTTDDNGKILQVVGSKWVSTSYADSTLKIEVESAIDAYISEALGGEY